MSQGSEGSRCSAPGRDVIDLSEDSGQMSETSGESSTASNSKILRSLFTGRKKKDPTNRAPEAGQGGDQAVYISSDDEGAGGAGSGAGGSRSGQPASAAKRSHPADAEDKAVTKRPAVETPALQYDGASFRLLKQHCQDRKCEGDKYAVSMPDLLEPGAAWALAGNYIDEVGLHANTKYGLHALSRCPVAFFAGDGHIPGPRNYTVFNQELGRFGSHHSKFFILSYEAKGVLRVIVSTANNRDMDYTCNTNAVWVQDFPRKKGAGGASSEFEEDLVRYFEAYKDNRQGVRNEPWKLRVGVGRPDVTAETLREFDFSGAKAKLVASVPGFFYKGKDAFDWWGLNRLRSLLGRERFPDRLRGSHLVLQSTSYGCLNQENFFNQLLQALETGLGTADDVQVVHTSVEEARTSLRGYKMAGCIPVKLNQLKYTEKQLLGMGKPSLLGRLALWGKGGDQALELSERYAKLDQYKELYPKGGGAAGVPQGWGSGQMGEHGEGREKIIPHIKTFLRYHKETKEIAFCMVGSHNMSKMAFGTVPATKDTHQMLTREWKRQKGPRKSKTPNPKHHCTLSVDTNKDTPPQHPKPKGGKAGASAKPNGAGGPQSQNSQAPESERIILPSFELSVLLLPSLHREEGRPEVRFEATHKEGRGYLPPGIHHGPDATVVALPIPFRLPALPYRPGTDFPWLCDKAIPNILDSQGEPYPPSPFG